MRRSRTSIWSSITTPAPSIALVLLSILVFIVGLWVVIFIVRLIVG